METLNNPPSPSSTSKTELSTSKSQLALITTMIAGLLNAACVDDNTYAQTEITETTPECTVTTEIDGCILVQSCETIEILEQLEKTQFLPDIAELHSQLGEIAHKEGAINLEVRSYAPEAISVEGCGDKDLPFPIDINTIGNSIKTINLLGGSQVEVTIYTNPNFNINNFSTKHAEYPVSSFLYSGVHNDLSNPPTSEDYYKEHLRITPGSYVVHGINIETTFPTD